MKKCYSYVPTDDRWEVSGTLANSQSESGFGYSSELGLILAGGKGYKKVSTTLDGMTITQVHTILNDGKLGGNEQIDRESKILVG